MRRLGSVLALCLALSAPSAARARSLFDEGDLRLELRSAFKSSLLLSFPYQTDPILFPDPSTGGGLFRLRFDLNANIGEYFTAAVAYEHRARASSGGLLAARTWRRRLPARSAVAPSPGGTRCSRRSMRHRASSPRIGTTRRRWPRSPRASTC